MIFLTLKIVWILANRISTTQRSIDSHSTFSHCSQKLEGKIFVSNRETNAAICCANNINYHQLFEVIHLLIDEVNFNETV